MKNWTIAVILTLLLPDIPFAQVQQEQTGRKQAASPDAFPESMEYIVQPHYRHRPDGKPGREITLYFKGSGFSGKATLELTCNGKRETHTLDSRTSMDHYTVLLPPGAGVNEDCEAEIVLKRAERILAQSIHVPARRQWTVYIYPHSHVDIGYTNTQENVEIIHRRNLIRGIELAKATAGYPDDARYLWNPEVLWPVERYLAKATPAERDKIVDAVQKGFLHLDAAYVHTNTSASADEEFYEFFRPCAEIEKLTHTKIETLVQVDIPGMSWGLVPVAAKLGIRYCFVLNNGSDRVGNSMEISFKPFWWIGPDGRSKVLFLQPGSYNPGARYKGYAFWPLMAGQTDTARLLQVVKTANPRENFIDGYLAEKLPELEGSDYYPYDIFAMTWAMADNTPIDADLPDAVKSWNEDYAFPHLVIASATEIMRTFETQYGDRFPVLRGDFTEYWTDGLGAAARQTGMNRASKERLIQAETLWSMVNPGKPAPRDDFSEAWRNVILGTEHTWCFMDPGRQPISGDILKVKFGYFQEAENRSRSLLNSALSGVSHEGSPVIAVFNTLSWSRDGLVSIPAEQSRYFGSVRDERGDVLSQRLSTGELVFMARDVPALGSKKYYFHRKKYKASGKMVQGSTLDNGIVRVVLDPQSGDIISLTHDEMEFADPGAACNVNSYRYLYGDDPPDKAIGTRNVRISTLENGPVLATLLVESDGEGCKYVSREITVIAGQPLVEITNRIDKTAVLKKEGIHFGFAFNLSDPVIRADIPWGVMELESDQLPEGNRNWITFQRWLDVSGKNHGITWCSLDAPVFEMGDITANVLGAATNSPRWIRKIQPSAVIYSWALNNHWHTNFPLSQEGKIQFRYRILPHNTGYNAALSNHFGLEQAQPLIACPVHANFSMKQPLSIQAKNVVVSILKTDNDGKSTQVRLRSVSDEAETVKINWTDRKPGSVYFYYPDEEPCMKEIQDEVSVPAMGTVTLQVIW